MIVGYEGASVAERRADHARRCGALGGDDLGEERGQSWAEGRFHAPYLRDSMLDAGVLVETLETATFWSNRERLYSGGEDRTRDVARRGHAGALPHLPRLRDRVLALLHRGDRAGRRPAGAVAGRQGRGVRRDDRRRAPRSPTTTPSAPTTSPGWRRRSVRSAWRCCAGSRTRSTRPASSTRGCSSRERALLLPDQPALRWRCGSGGRRTRRADPARRRGRRGRDLLPRRRERRADLVDAAVGRGDVVVSVGGDGMLSSLAGAGVRAAAARSAWCRPVAATTSSACSGSPHEPQTWPRCCSTARRPRSTCSSVRLGDAARAHRRRIGVRRRGRDRRRGRRPGPLDAEEAAVPLRRRAVAGDVPPGRRLRRRRRRGRTPSARRPSSSPTRLLRLGHEDRADGRPCTTACSTSSSSRPRLVAS